MVSESGTLKSLARRNLRRITSARSSSDKRGMPHMEGESVVVAAERLFFRSWRAFRSEDLRWEMKYVSSLKEGERRVATSIREETKLFFDGNGGLGVEMGEAATAAATAGGGGGGGCVDSMAAVVEGEPEMVGLLGLVQC